MHCIIYFNIVAHILLLLKFAEKSLIENFRDDMMLEMLAYNMRQENDKLFMTHSSRFPLLNVVVFHVEYDAAPRISLCNKITFHKNT